MYGKYENETRSQQVRSNFTKNLLVINCLLSMKLDRLTLKKVFQFYFYIINR